MHGIGTFIWVLLLAIGVISSIRSTARRQAAQPSGTQRGGRRIAVPQPSWWEQQPPEAAPPPPPPPVAPPKPPAAATPVVAVARAPQTHRARLFGNRHALVGAVIASEVLGKPRGLYPE